MARCSIKESNFNFLNLKNIILKKCADQNRYLSPKNAIYCLPKNHNPSKIILENQNDFFFSGRKNGSEFNKADMQPLALSALRGAAAECSGTWQVLDRVCRHGATKSSPSIRVLHPTNSHHGK